MDYYFEDKPFPLFARWNDGETQCTSDCLTTTVYETQYYDEHGRTTTCLTTATETTWQPARPTTTPAPGQPTTTTVNVQTVTMTQTSIIKEGSQPLPTAAAPMPSPAPHPPTSSVQPPAESTKGYDQCDCERQWIKLFLGGLPHGAGEVFACLAFFFPLAVLLVVCFLRVLRWGLHDREILFLLLPTLLFLLLVVAALPTRAYVATNGDAGIDTTNHYLAQHVLFTIAPSLLVEAALQLYGFLSRRSVRGQWVDSSALALRVINFVALVLYIVAAATFVGFVNDWQIGTTSCWSHTPAFVGRLTIVADILELIVLVLALICLVMARWRLRIQTGVLVIQYLLYALFLVHFIYRFIHDLFLAAIGWTHRQDRACEPAAGQTVFVSSQQQTVLARPIDWSQLHEAAGEGVNGAAAFWLLFVLPLFIAVLLLMAANLPCYVGAVPLPDPCPDTVRYKLCYNEESQKMEFQRVDNAGGPRLPSGEPLYELVRDKDGEGWAVREATVSTIPVFDHITFSPWYR